MASLSHPDSRRKYSWWWDSHISPKNSKWLQENLTDMDAKVKQMIKLIEEDADSFARRAEMYYKKRPELMKLVEEFYRAYRALAERYDHATGALRQAQRTMAEAFPNQVPFLTDDSPAGSSAEAEPHTPEMPPPVRAFFEPDELQKDALGLSSSHFHPVKRNGAFTEEPDSVSSKKGLKQLNDLFGSGDAPNIAKFAEGRARKGLNFHDADEKERNVQNTDSHNLKPRVLPESEQVGKTATEILALKESLARLEAEKEAGRVQHQQSLERLSNLEAEVSRAQEDSKGLNERAGKAENEVQTLKEALTKLEAERETSLLQYQQCLERISDLERTISHAQEDAGKLNERASKSETEAAALKQDLARVESEKKKISDLESKLVQAEEDARRINERAEKAEREVETLKQAVASLTEEKEAAARQYQQCLETIASLELKISCAEEEAQRLNGEIDNGVAKLKGAEEQCLLLERTNHSLQFELESLAQKLGAQCEELTEKQKELGRLWTSIQEERLRFMEAETAFQTLQHLHSQSQEELRSLATELQSRGQILKDTETHNQENRGLNELNLSSAVSIKNMQDEILSLRETIMKLEMEVELRVDQRNALQQEIYCLKEELNDLNKNYRAMLDQVEGVGLNPECFGLSVKELQEENSNLKEICQRGKSENVALLEKLEIMEKLLEKNALLENSLSDLSAELEGLREKVKALEESYQSLLGEKSILVAENATLTSHLQTKTNHLEKFSEKNMLMENSLSDANAELEGLRTRSKGLEDSCQLLDNDKSGLISEKETLISQLEATQQRLEDLERRYTELEEKYFGLEKEKESTLCKVEELQVSLEAEKLEQANFAQLSETRLAGMKSEIHLLQVEGQCRKEEFEEEQNKVVNSQIEIFILQKCVQELAAKNFSLLTECQKLSEVSKLSEKLISELEHENLEQQVQVNSLFDQVKMLRTGMYHVSRALDIDAEHRAEDKIDQDQTVLNDIICQLENTKRCLCKTQDENRQSIVQKLVLVTVLEQLGLEATQLATERNTLDEECRIRSVQFSSLQSETHQLLEVNKKLGLKVREGDHREEVLTDEIEILQGKLLELQKAHGNLQKENSLMLEEKGSLSKKFLSLEEEKRILEEENWVVFGETITLSNLSLIFKDFITEKSVQLKELGQNLEELHNVNYALEEQVRTMEGKLGMVEMENFHLKDSLEKSENELNTVRSFADQLNHEIENGRDILSRKEMELLEAGQKLSALQDEKAELHKTVEVVKSECDEVKVIREDQEKQILKLSEENDHQKKENGCLHEVNRGLEAKLWKLCEEIEEAKVREETLNHDLQRGRDEVELWETQAAAFFSELQISTVREAFFEEKVHELIKACEGLENRTATFFGELQISTVHEALFKEKVHELIEACKSLENISNSRSREIELLKERVNKLEGENGGLKTQLAAYTPTIISLRDSVAALENRTLSHTNLHQADTKDEKDAKSVGHLHVESSQDCSENQIAMVPEGNSDLQDLQTRIKAIEKGLIDMERLALEEHLDTNAKLEAAMKQIEELKSQRSFRRENIQTSRHLNPQQEEEELGDGTCDDRKLHTKDIMLDQISECSSYGISRRETAEVDDQMLELWETTDPNGSIALTVAKAHKGATAPVGYHQVVAEGHKSEHPSSEIMVEKELGVDKLEISKRFVEPGQEGNKRKTLERLASDAQKLTNLQITVQDLKRKVQFTEDSRNVKGIEYDTVKGQLEEVEEAILKLCDSNSKLTKNIEDNSLSDGKPAMELEESRSVRRGRISEQARKGSEKIGRLQLEVQRIQFLLLKLDDEKEGKAKTRISEPKRRVLLRDYLYGGRRTTHKRKKAHFCSCVQSPTTGD
ncbi:hypothetical protein PVL29_008398 [Vitis rotundifolia]|uniref:NAB domain-containing protein n=1 Tax=Vitis rotundifolia TaxID=103349 RepID=A0AA38ZVM6_VITRO|nr:hypothetical protein PVL29_008398 [Vitis rotundifolia]